MTVGRCAVPSATRRLKLSAVVPATTLGKAARGSFSTSALQTVPAAVATAHALATATLWLKGVASASATAPYNVNLASAAYTTSAVPPVGMTATTTARRKGAAMPRNNM